MIYRFGTFELDTATVELRDGGEVRPLEPQVFRLLALLVENGERLVSKDEIVEKVWDGRVVSDAAVSSRIKSARQALGDDGKAQRFIKTLHGQGFRFVAEVRGERAHTIVPRQEPQAAESVAASRPSIAVLPFRFIGSSGPNAGIADALADELILELARTRWLFVIARGSSFRLRGTEDLAEVRRLLGVRYCLSGVVEIAGSNVVVRIELADTRDGGVVWGDAFTGTLGDLHAIRARICSQIAAALEVQIPLHEAGLARLASPENLDAWLAYHLGLQHMYRFNHRDNSDAAALFTRAIAREPSFARAHAGMSFVHFQNAFMRHTGDLAAERTLARSFAERGLELDPMDPFVNFTMGRTFWLEGNLDESRAWLERATTISPSYAQGIYARAWTEALSGRGAEGRHFVDLAMTLSPLDPLYYAMLATRSLSHMAEREDAEAAQWAERAARSPGAHVLIAMIAAVAHTLGGNEERAGHWAANVRTRGTALTREDFFRSFPMKSAEIRARVDDALARLGF